MNIPRDCRNKTSSNRKYKLCETYGCENILQDTSYTKYCTMCRDSGVLDEKYKKNKKDKWEDDKEYPTSINVIIPNNQKHKYMNKYIHIRCSATCQNGRCENTIKVSYNASTTVYPRYCDEHRNHYKRERYESGNKPSYIEAEDEEYATEEKNIESSESNEG